MTSSNRASFQARTARRLYVEAARVDFGREPVRFAGAVCDECATISRVSDTPRKSPLNLPPNENYDPLHHAWSGRLEQRTTYDSVLKLDDDIHELKNQAEDLSNLLKRLVRERERQARSTQPGDDEKEVQSKLAAVDNRISSLSHQRTTLNRTLGLSRRVKEAAYLRLLKRDEELTQTFVAPQEIDSCWVLAADIRQSVMLMDKARSPRDYAKFIVELIDRLREAITSNYGVFDKFTGDGLLAFFPSRYSGPDAGLCALKAAEECHRAWKDCYDANMRRFNSAPESGLGIGIDEGEVLLFDAGDGLTVIGSAVVSACRLCSAPAGTTLVNQTAAIKLKESAYTGVGLVKTLHRFKEGNFHVFGSTLYEPHASPRTPSWVERNEPPATTSGQPAGGD